MGKVQSVEMFISSTDATATTGYLSYKIIALIDNSQNYIHTHTHTHTPLKVDTVQSTNPKFLKKNLEHRRKSLSP